MRRGGTEPADCRPGQRCWLTSAIIAGHGSTPTGDIEKVTGRKPATFREFAERNARAWAVEAK